MVLTKEVLKAWTEARLRVGTHNRVPFALGQLCFVRYVVPYCRETGHRIQGKRIFPPDNASEPPGPQALMLSRLFDLSDFHTTGYRRPLPGCVDVFEGVIEAYNRRHYSGRPPFDMTWYGVTYRVEPDFLMGALATLTPHTDDPVIQELAEICLWVPELRS